MTLKTLAQALKGGSGSGNFGHGGRPGKRGGSTAKGGLSGDGGRGGTVLPSGIETRQTIGRVQDFGDLKIRKVGFGRDAVDGSAIIHDKDWAGISKLKSGGSLNYVDEQNKGWKVSKVGSQLLFEGKKGASMAGFVPFSDLR